MAAGTVKNSMQVTQKAKNRTAFYLAIPLLGICRYDPKTLIQKNLCTTVFIAALFTVAKIWKQPKCPSVDENIKILVHLHSGILLSRMKKALLLFVTAWVELESIMLSEISQVVKDKYHMISPIGGT